MESSGIQWQWIRWFQRSDHWKTKDNSVDFWPSSLKFRNERHSWNKLEQIAGCLENKNLAVDFETIPGIDLRYTSGCGKEFDLLHRDEPQISRLMPPRIELTSPDAYFRFHGRNAQSWWSGNGVERYNYDYSLNEIQQWNKAFSLWSRRRERFLYFLTTVMPARQLEMHRLWKNCLVSHCHKGECFSGCGLCFDRITINCQRPWRTSETMLVWWSTNHGNNVKILNGPIHWCPLQIFYSDSVSRKTKLTTEKR